MTFVWVAFLFVWAFILIFNGDKSTLLWFFLFFLWLGLTIHYVRTYREWKKELVIRQQERQTYVTKVDKRKKVN